MASGLGARAFWVQILAQAPVSYVMLALLPLFSCAFILPSAEWGFVFVKPMDESLALFVFVIGIDG